MKKRGKLDIRKRIVWCQLSRNGESCQSSVAVGVVLIDVKLTCPRANAVKSCPRHR